LLGCAGGGGGKVLLCSECVYWGGGGREVLRIKGPGVVDGCHSPSAGDLTVNTRDVSSRRGLWVGEGTS
jgi:hypothetical protein